MPLREMVPSAGGAMVWVLFRWMFQMRFCRVAREEATASGRCSFFFAATPSMQAHGRRPPPAGVALVAPASSPVRWRRNFVAAAALTLIALCGCALLSHKQSTSDLLILGENPVFEPFTGFSTAGMASENPNTGATFAHLIQMAYECTEELKRSLRGLSERDYDAEVRVSFIETMILKLVDRLADDEGRDDVPDFQHLPRGASFKTAVHKIAVFARLVKLLPNEDWFETDNMRAVQYGEIRYDLRMIAQALRREVKDLQFRHFDSHEPVIPHYIQSQRTIRGTVARLTSQHPAEWAQMGVDFQKQLDFGMPLRASQEPLALGAARPAALGVVRSTYPVQTLRKLPMLDIRKAVTNRVSGKQRGMLVELRCWPALWFGAIIWLCAAFYF